MTSSRTFNRTSMESKLLSLTQSQASVSRLLIEPVWNRNSDTGTSLPSAHILLIEPVWNRNRAILIQTDTGVGTFNRTSMESKLKFPIVAFICADTFNRTSMESKLLNGYDKMADILSLLIEPVWNRNVGSQRLSQCPIPRF